MHRTCLRRAWSAHHGPRPVQLLSHPSSSHTRVWTPPQLAHPVRCIVPAVIHPSLTSDDSTPSASRVREYAPQNLSVSLSLCLHPWHSCTVGVTHAACVHSTIRRGRQRQSIDHTTNSINASLMDDACPATRQLASIDPVPAQRPTVANRRVRRLWVCGLSERGRAVARREE